MRTLTSLALLAMLSFGMPFSASADDDGHRHAKRGHDYHHVAQHPKQHRFARKLDRRFDRQWRRIEDGIHSGELTRREARKLRRQQRKLARLEAHFYEDGWFSRWERREMMDALDAASERIKRLKHNDRYRHGGDQFRVHLRF